MKTPAHKPDGYACGPRFIAASLLLLAWASASGQQSHDHGVWHAEDWCSIAGHLDETCIQRAIDDIAINGSRGIANCPSGTIALPIGTYLIHAPLRMEGCTRIELEGARIGAWGSVLQAVDGADILHVSSDTINVHDVVFRGTEHGTTGSGIVLGTDASTTFDAYITRNWFVALPTASVICKNCSGIHFGENTFDTAPGHAIVAEPAASAKCESIQVVNNRFFLYTLGAISVKGASGTGTSNVRWWTITGNIFDQNGVAKYPDTSAISLTRAHGFTIAANVFDHNQASDIRMQAVDTVAVNANISSDPGSSFVSGSGMRAITIVGNTGSRVDSVLTAAPWVDIPQFDKNAGNVITSNAFSSPAARRDHRGD